MISLNRLSIVIVNWNAGSQLFESVSSIIQHHNGLVSSVIIVDNASTDDSLAQVETLKELPFQLQFIRNSDNRGFGAACNQGAALASTEYLLFLNPDTRLFGSSLTVPLAYMQASKNQDVGVVGIQLLDEQNSISRSCARFPTLGIFIAQALGFNRLPGLHHINMHMADWPHNETRTVDHVIGAFYLMRRSVFDSLGGFDERFFVYLEDLDLSLCVRNAGYGCVYLADAQAFHAGGGTSRNVKARRLFYSLHSRLHYGFKHFSATKAWCLLFVTLAIEPVTRLTLALIKGSLSDAFHTIQAYGLLLQSLTEVLLFPQRKLW